MKVLKEKLLKFHNEYIRKTQQYDQYYEDHSRISQEIQMKHQALEAFKETVAVFKDQISLHETFQKQVAQHEMAK